MNRRSDGAGGIRKVGAAIAAILAFAVLVAVLLSAAFGLTWLGIEWRGFFGPKRAAVEREIFEQTPSYIYGKSQDLARFRHEWVRGDDTEKAAIESTIRVMFAEFDSSQINDPGLRAFLQGAME